MKKIILSLISLVACLAIFILVMGFTHVKAGGDIEVNEQMIAQAQENAQVVEVAEEVVPATITKWLERFSGLDYPEEFFEQHLQMLEEMDEDTLVLAIPENDGSGFSFGDTVRIGGMEDGEYVEKIHIDVAQDPDHATVGQIKQAMLEWKAAQETTE